MVSINIFGSNNSNLYDFVRYLDLNNNSIHNLKEPEYDLDGANKRYVDSMLGGENTGMLTLEADKEFSFYFGNNKNAISWRNRVTQLLKFTASAGFLFTMGRIPLLTISSTSGIKTHKNIDLGSNCRIINSQMPVND